MKTKDIFGLLILMLLSTAAGIFVYQTLINTPSHSEPLINTVNFQSRMNTDKIELSELLVSEITGSNTDLSRYQGKHLIINFWATWCPPCRKEIPLFMDIQTRYANQNVQVIGIAMDDRDKVAQYIQDFDLNYPSFISDLTQTTQFSQQLNYSFIALPFTFFIDENGKLIHTKTGELKAPEMEKWVKQLTQAAAQTTSQTTE